MNRATRTTTDSREPDHAVIAILMQACDDFRADRVERLALFEAAIVASGLRAEFGDPAAPFGVLGQNPSWGPPAARRDPYTAASVFLKQARWTRTGSGTPRHASRLAGLVQGAPGAWRHALAYRAAKHVCLGTACSTANSVPARRSVHPGRT
jgi:hypothetical protein